MLAKQNRKKNAPTEKSDCGLVEGICKHQSTSSRLVHAILQI